MKWPELETEAQAQERLAELAHKNLQDWEPPNPPLPRVSAWTKEFDDGDWTVHYGRDTRDLGPDCGCGIQQEHRHCLHCGGLSSLTLGTMRI